MRISIRACLRQRVRTCVRAVVRAVMRAVVRAVMRAVVRVGAWVRGCVGVRGRVGAIGFNLEKYS